MSFSTRLRWAGLFLLQGAALFAWLGWQSLSTNAQETIAPPSETTVIPAQAAEVIAADRTPWVGVTGCAAAACHGGPIDQRRGEYTTWITRDPHARAFSTLFSERSLEMARLLAGGDAKEATPPHEDKRCLTCHAPTGPSSEHAPRLASDGVGCEACHGAAHAWVTQHSTVRWSELNPTERSAKRRELGMTDMHDPLVRVQQCTACHVGSAAADVNHDLIAAGHPRMSFEMGAFHAELPKHWPDKEERRRDPALDAKLWAIGQAESAAMYHELVAAQKRGGVHFDFANYDCYACHHELRSPGWRQRDKRETGHAGDLLPLDWYKPTFPGFEGAKTPLNTVNHLTLPRSYKTEYHRALVGLFLSWGKQLATSNEWSLEKIESLIAETAATPPADLNWDTATQWYLALVALERSRLDFNGSEPPTEHDRQVQAELLAIKLLLNFPVGVNGTQLNSPRDFDPAEFRVAADRLQALIAARPRAADAGGTP